MLKRTSKINHLLIRKAHKWVQPDGYDTGIKIYTCILKENVPLVVSNKNLVKWYTCGPTVYDSAHLGHASCYVKLDTIQRILKNYFHLNLVTVMNITDIDDKIILRSRELQIGPSELCKHFEKEFWQDLQLLNIPKPDLTLRVTDNIPTIIKFIEKLVTSGKAYKAEDNSVYFDVENYGNYGKLQRLGENSGNKGVKKSMSDFVVWKAVKAGEPYWDSLWGPGRPGWHIECSALASLIFGDKIDIHAGGIDLKFPHHENEDAQSCSFHDTNQWVNYWLHTGHLQVDATKMSKSLKNTIKIGDFFKVNKVEIFRLACVMSHYKDPFIYSDELMKTAGNLFKNYKNFIQNCADYAAGNLKCAINKDVLLKLLTDSSQNIDGELRNDFYTPGVINNLNKIVSTFNGMLGAESSGVFEPGVVLALSKLVQNSLNLLGVEFESHKTDNSFVEIMNILNNLRQEVRLVAVEEKNSALFKLCDTTREDLKRCGITVKDLGKVSTWF